MREIIEEKHMNQKMKILGIQRRAGTWKIYLSTIVFFIMIFRPTVLMYNQSLRFYFNYIQLVGLAMLISLPLIQIIRSRRISKESAVVLMWNMLILWSTFLNDLPMGVCVRNTLSMLTIFLYVEWITQISFEKFIKSISFCVYIYAILDVFAMVTTGLKGLFPEMNIITGTPLYFVNGKFQNSYLQLFLSMIVVATTEKSKKIIPRYRRLILYLFMIVLNITVTQYVHCTTGTIITLIFWISYFIPAIRKILRSPGRFFIVFAILNFLIVVFQITLKSSFLQFVVLKVLGKQLSLTGRTDIYSGFLETINGQWLFGKGYGNTVIFNMTGSYANSQNVFLESILTSGILGTTCMLYILFKAINKELLKSSSFIAAAFVAAFIGYFTAGIVEVCFDNWFYLLVAMAIAYRKKYLVNECVS